LVAQHDRGDQLRLRKSGPKLSPTHFKKTLLGTKAAHKCGLLLQFSTSCPNNRSLGVFSPTLVTLNPVIPIGENLQILVARPKLLSNNNKIDFRVRKHRLNEAKIILKIGTKQKKSE
jgi:hypothetical protein